MAFVVAAEAARGDGISESEERRRRAAAGDQALDVQPLLVLEHRLQPLTAYVAGAGSINGIRHFHVIGGNAFGDGAGGTAGAEEPTDHFLARTDFGEAAIAARIEVYLQRLLARRNRVII